jgi:hypothetical protein
MSDFDEVLERLLNEPSFAAALAADPREALAGYRLDPEERDLLLQQFSTDSSADVAVVESRITKSSTFGLIAPLAALGGLADQVGGRLTGSGGSPFTAGAASADSLASTASAASSPPHLGPWSEFGTAAGIATDRAAGLLDVPPAHEGLAGPTAHEALAGPTAHQGLGGSPQAWGEGGGAAAARSGLGEAPDLDGLPAVSRLGEAPASALGEPHRIQAEAEHLRAPQGYHNRVDADGDGTWDKATYRGGVDGGADILVDLNHDGRADFVGHDTDVDNRVDYADFDKNHDGIFEKRMYDDDGDGWLDRTVWRTE